MKETKQPFVRIAKREELGKKQTMLLRLAAIVAALLAGAVFIAILGENPLAAYGSILKGAFVGSQRNPLSSIQTTIVYMVPLLVVSLGLSVAFRMKFWNIGGEGQIIMGGIFASYFAINHSDWPHLLLLLAMGIAGAVGGGLWGLLPAICKVKFGTNETLFTLMLNYIALYCIVYLESGPWKRTPGFASVGLLDANAYLTKVAGVHSGWIIALLLLGFLFYYINYTKQGYEISVVGESAPTARYAGMQVNRIVLRTMFISGAICGLAGMIQVAGNDHTLSTGITGNVGFTGITVAWLSQLNPVTIGVVSFLLSVLKKGSGDMQMHLGLSSYAADVLQATILFFVLGFDFFLRYRLVFRGKPAQALPKKEETP